MLKIFSQPYPYISELKPNLRFHIFIGIFVAFFLIVFQPFGTDRWVTDYKVLKLFGYGFISFLVPTILLLIRNKVFINTDIETKYLVWHEIIWYVIILLSIALGNVFYAQFLGITAFSLQTFLVTVGIVLSIGIFPIMASIFIKHQQFLTINQQTAAAVENNLFQTSSTNTIDPIEKVQSDTIRFIAENEKDFLEIPNMDLLFIESEDNYASFHFFKNGQLKKELLRGSLKRFEGQITDKFIVRCHRKYIVNLSRIEHIKGNAQGFQITLNYGSTVIPVSRNYTSQISQLIEK